MVLLACRHRSIRGWWPLPQLPQGWVPGTTARCNHVGVTIPAIPAASSHTVSDLVGPASRPAEWLLLSLSKCAGLPAGQQHPLWPAQAGCSHPGPDLCRSRRLQQHPGQRLAPLAGDCSQGVAWLLSGMPSLAACPVWLQPAHLPQRRLIASGCWLVTCKAGPCLGQKGK